MCTTSVIIKACDAMLKVSQFQKQILKFSFEPKISALGLKNGSNQKIIISYDK